MTISDEDLAQARGLSPQTVQQLRQTRGTTTETLEQLSDTALQRALRRLNYPDLAAARQHHLHLISVDDRGRVAPDALAHAVRQAQTMRRRAPGADGAAGMPAGRSVAPLALVGAQPEPPATARAAGLAPHRWEWLGPGNVGGRTRALLVHPRDPQRMLAGSAGGGVWFTADGGARWDPVDDFMANLAVSCLAMDPTDPNLVYAGTGEGFGNVDALRGGGIFRIVGGASWESIPATTGFGAVNRLAVSRNGRTLLAATPDGLMRSTDAALATWTRVLGPAMADVKFHPTLARRAVAGGLRDGSAWFSTDGGASWKAAVTATPWSGRVELAYARKDPRVVYASVQGRRGEGGWLWRSTDGGRTYQPRRALDPAGRRAPFLGDQGWYGNVVWAGDPTDADLVLVGGVNVWRSTDGGDTMREISTWWSPQSLHADHHVIVAHPRYDGTRNRAVFFGNDGGIFEAADLAQCGTEAQAPFDQGWQELNNNYGVTQFYGGAVHAPSGRVVAGAQDNGSLALAPGAGSERWTTWFGGDGGWCAADPTDPQVFYGEYVFLNIHRNTDGCTTNDDAGDRYISGQFWNAALDRWDWKPVPFQITDAKDQAALFIAPFTLDPGQSHRLLAGGMSLWETVDAHAPNTPTSGPRWRSVKPSTGVPISAVAVSPVDGDVVWVGHLDGAVFRSTDARAATPSWQRRDHHGVRPLTPQRMCTRLVPHPTDADTAYATFGGYVADNVWVTRDGGATWTALGRSLPAAPVRTLAIHPTRPDRVYAGTEVGVFGSDDAGRTWSPTNEGPANVSVDELFWSGTALLAATHGRGMYRIELGQV